MKSGEELQSKARARRVHLGRFGMHIENIHLKIRARIMSLKHFALQEEPMPPPASAVQKYTHFIIPHEQW